MNTTNAYPPAEGAVTFGRSVTVRFPAKPSGEIRETLKQSGFHYSTGKWTYEVADREDAIKVTRIALGLGAVLDLCGKLTSGFGYFEKVIETVGDVALITDTPRFLRAQYKDYLKFDSVSELLSWMKSFQSDK